MTAAIRQLLQMLDEDQRQLIHFSFGDDERFNWHYVPRARRGLSLEAMTSGQRVAVQDLLEAALSGQGAAKVRDILVIEGILGEMEAAGSGAPNPIRNPQGYFLTLFGGPSESEPWGWRFEGHHLSLNFSTASGLVAATPAFYGANPAEVPVGFERSGLRALADEEDLGRRMVESLDTVQRAKAVFSETAPREIVSGATREVQLERPIGLPFCDMTDEQQKLLRRIIAAYVDNLSPEIAANYWQRIADRGWKHVHFAWAGGIGKGEGHYYRVQGPTLMIEYDNFQNNANHVHSVWRDLENDWGGDFLRRHHEAHDHP